MATTDPQRFTWEWAIYPDSLSEGTKLMKLADHCGIRFSTETGDFYDSGGRQSSYRVVLRDFAEDDVLELARKIKKLVANSKTLLDE